MSVTSNQSRKIFQIKNRKFLQIKFICSASDVDASVGTRATLVPVFTASFFEIYQERTKRTTSGSYYTDFNCSRFYYAFVSKFERYPVHRCVSLMIGTVHCNSAVPQNGPTSTYVPSKYYVIVSYGKTR